MKTAHTDLGYEGYEHTKRADLADYIDHACRLADATAQAPDQDRYRWTIEHLHWFYGNLAQRPWPWLRNLVDQYIKPGRMALTGVQSGVVALDNVVQALKHTLSSKKKLIDINEKALLRGYELY